jgi:hypothetical protein
MKGESQNDEKCPHKVSYRRQNVVRIANNGNVVANNGNDCAYEEHEWLQKMNDRAYEEHRGSQKMNEAVHNGVDR